MSKAPTAAQKRRFAKLIKIGCMACLQKGVYTIPEIHHWREYGYRDHWLSYPLCMSHHRSFEAGAISRHGQQREFEEQFGTDSELYAWCEAELIKIK